MYNEELETLIDAALTDGVLTEKEKQILFKKAQTMGVDLDEFEMVLDARLVKLKKAEKAKESAPKSNKLGDVKKCPNCGAIVQSYQGRCHECGYEFEDVDANEAVKELSKLLVKGKNKSEIIRTFPIPPTKSALIEFMSYLQSNTSSKQCGDAFAAKLQECIIKAKTFYSNDTQLTLLVNNIEEAENKRLANNYKLQKRKNMIKVLRFLLGLILIAASFFVGYYIWKLEWKVFWKLNAIIIASSPLFFLGIVAIVPNEE